MNATPIPLRNVMTDDEYDRRRAEIGDQKAAKEKAGIRWEQELARLFHSSGWTQERLAEKEGRGQQYISRLVLFGRFLEFTPMGVESEKLPFLSERRFRGYWNQTTTPTGKRDNQSTHERERFQQVIRLMEATKPDLVKDRTPQQYGRKLAEKCGDGRWRSEREMAEMVAEDIDSATVENIHGSLGQMMRSTGSHGVRAEHRTVGTENHYRLFKQDKTVSYAELAEKLRPIIKKLKVEGKKNMATMVPAAVAMLAHDLEKLLDQLGE